MYKPNMIVLESTGLMKKGSLVIADSMIFHEAPEYRAYIESQTRVRNRIVTSMLEYSRLRADGLMVSEFVE